MADEPQDPPIGTAQNAADMARKAEWEVALLGKPIQGQLAERLKVETYSHDMTAEETVAFANRQKRLRELGLMRQGLVEHRLTEGALPWNDGQIAEAFALMSRDPSPDEFREALSFLVVQTMRGD